MTRFTILLGGTVVQTRRLAALTRGTRVIAADSGIAHAEVLGLDVELWVGDFDSADAKLHSRYAKIERWSHARDKAKTDGELATDAAVDRGATSLVLVGGFGGQADHVLGHVALALGLARRGIATVLTSGEEEAYPIVPGRTVLDLPAGTRLSLIPMSDLDGLVLTGTRWPLSGVSVPLGSTLTLSNVAEAAVTIELSRGTAIAVAYPVDEILDQSRRTS